MKTCSVCYDGPLAPPCGWNAKSIRGLTWAHAIHSQTFGSMHRWNHLCKESVQRWKEDVLFIAHQHSSIHVKCVDLGVGKRHVVQRDVIEFANEKVASPVTAAGTHVKTADGRTKALVGGISFVPEAFFPVRTYQNGKSRAAMRDTLRWCVSHKSCNVTLCKQGINSVLSAAQILIISNKYSTVVYLNPRTIVATIHGYLYFVLSKALAAMPSALDAPTDHDHRRGQVDFPVVVFCCIVAD